MQQTRLAPLVGIAGCVLVLVVAAAPYWLVETAPGTAVGTYYGTGAVNPLVGVLFALLSLIVLAAGREARTDPGLAAGVALTLGLFLVVVAALWALTVPEGVVGGLSENALLEHHRWALVASGLPIPIASAWWARTLDLV